MAATVTTYRVPVDGAAEHAPGRWGMALLIVTEASLFAYLLFSYFYLGSISRAPWPLAAPSLRLALPNTIILLVSSATMWWSDRAIRQGRAGRLRAGLLITLVLGIIFLFVQSLEYRAKQFTPTTDAYGSLFFTITGFHGAHVAVGLLMILVVLLRAWLGHFDAEHRLAVTNTAMYWHFVDVVWLAVFTSLYLTPRLR
ncbi:MAG TPA: cytochrome c oxidase subunit 3 [Gemmatimonadales bacterium]|nr:cytochrome c oxidase subunit 3 [Gemmatimonadales bacterium]